MNRNNYPASSSGPPPPQSHERYDRQPQPPQPPPPSFLPPPPPTDRSWNDHQSQQDRRSEHQFRGPYSSLRQTRSDDRHRSNDDYRDRDSHRPPQGDFTFRVERPSGIESYDSYRPPERDFGRAYDDERSSSHRLRHGENERSGGRDTRPRRTDDRRRQQRQYPSNAGRPRTGRYEKVLPADRLLLRKKHDDSAELMLGNTIGRATYRDVDELSDSDEAAMDISDNSDNSDSDADEPARKRARTSAATTSKPEQEVPRWSNPDPYTALPPPDESTRKKKDMVQLIRKARVEAEAKKPTTQTEGLDFISCDLSGDEKDNRYDNKKNPRTQNNRNDYNKHSVSHDAEGQDWRGTTRIERSQESIKKVGAVQLSGTNTSAPLSTSSTLPPKPPISLSTYEAHAEATSTGAPSSSTHGTNGAYGASTNTNPVDLTPSNIFGSRKRTYDESFKLLPQSSSKPSTKMHITPGNMVPEWRPVDDNSCPWSTTDHSEVSSIATRLHLEVLDFYKFVSPLDFENRVRGDLIENLRKLVKEKWSDADIYPFGSFTSGLYLPTSDMDIAVCSQSYCDYRQPRYDRKKDLYNLRTHLLYHRAAYNNDINVIAKAKVPLLKYTDKRTGLKVDISFENLSGHYAIETFLQWKKRYPAMPILVSIIKQFLMMRGLNEPVNGGIGGFSVICMIVNLFNQVPQIQSGTMVPEHHLGEVLMEFFDYYGNHFKYKTVAICLSPPMLISKTDVRGINYRNFDRISIIDPNNPENDISGGSSNTPMIMAHFAHAHKVLKERMAELSKKKGPHSLHDTLLAPLFAGNYSMFEGQRSILEHVSAVGYEEYEVKKRRPQRD